MSSAIAFGPQALPVDDPKPPRARREAWARAGEDGDGESGPLRRLLIRDRGRLVLLRLDDVDWIEGAGNYVRFHAGGEVHALRQTLAGLESRLDPARFVRVHRSTIVNLDRLVELRARPSGGYDLRLRDGSQLTLSRRHKQRFFALAGRT